jgi:formamidopyrimidine-DNA glycosylase
LGERILIGFGEELYLVIHSMIAGRRRWRPKGGKVPGTMGLPFRLSVYGVLLLTEAGTSVAPPSPSRKGKTHCTASTAAIRRPLVLSADGSPA